MLFIRTSLLILLHLGLRHVVTKQREVVPSKITEGMDADWGKICYLQELVTGFKGLGFSPEVKPLAFFQDDYGLKSDDGDEIEDDEDDEDDDDHDGDDENEDEIAA